MHTKDARAIGEDEQRLHLVAAWREAPFYTPRERAALAWAEELTHLPETGASDDAYEAMAREFDPAERVVLTMAIVAINGWNRLAVGFRLPVGAHISSRYPEPVSAEVDTPREHPGSDMPTPATPPTRAGRGEP